MRYKHVFFDLDRTLWDFDTNSRCALRLLYENHNLASTGIPNAESFLTVYEAINNKMWTAYSLGNITKRELQSRRFNEALAHFGYLDTKLAEKLNADYIKISPHQTTLLPEALETVSYLSQKYQLHIITNGFEEVQEIKMQKSGLMPFFNVVMTSEKAKKRKPDPLVFKLACKMAGTTPQDAIMIGDDLNADVRGAKSVRMDQVYFNPGQKAHEMNDITHEIKALGELRHIL